MISLRFSTFFYYNSRFEKVLLDLKSMDFQKRFHCCNQVFTCFEYFHATHSSRLAWNIINNLTNRTKRPRRLCPITANSLVSQLVKNGIYKTTNRMSGILVVKEVSQLWRIPTPLDKCISGDFSPEEFVNAL